MQEFLGKIFRRTSRIHPVVVLLVILLSLSGVLLLYDAGGGSFDPYASKHMMRLGAGILLMWMIALIPVKILLEYAYLPYLVAIGLLGFVAVSGHVGMGAQRWLNFGGFVLQPSELAKVSLVLVLARFYHRRPMSSIHTAHNLLWPLGLMGLMFGLVVMQPDLGTALVIAFLGASLMFVAGVSHKLFIGGGVIGLASLPIVWNFFLHDYQRKRLMVFLNPEDDPLGSGYHILQSKIAIGSSDFWGKGFLQGTQSHLQFLPEKHTDFIFTLLVEDFGMLGALSVILAFTLLVGTGMMIASRTQSKFLRFLAIGASLMVFIHATINMCMVMGLMPVVGIPLPFISYGGSSLMAMMVSMGLLLNAHVHKEVQLPGGGGLLNYDD